MSTRRDARDSSVSERGALLAPLRHLDVYVMEKPKPVVSKGLVKDGIHLVIPDIVTHPAVQFLIREKVLPDLETKLAHLGLQNPMKDVLDEAVIERNNWQMYGSKKPNCEAYDSSTPGLALGTVLMSRWAGQRTAHGGASSTACLIMVLLECRVSSELCNMCQICSLLVQLLAALSESIASPGQRSRGEIVCNRSAEAYPTEASLFEKT